MTAIPRSRSSSSPSWSAGSPAPCHKHAELFRRKLAVPSLHVTGRADTIVPRRDSLRLADRFADPLIIEHSGGHIIPAVTTPIAGFLAGFSRDGGATPTLDGSRSGQ